MGLAHLKLIIMVQNKISLNYMSLKIECKSYLC